MKCAQVDVEHIPCGGHLLADQLHSYHVYPYYPDYLNYILNPMTAMDNTPIWDSRPSSPVRRPVAPHRFRAAPVGYDKGPARRTPTPICAPCGGEASRDARRHLQDSAFPPGAAWRRSTRNTRTQSEYMSEQEQGRALVDCWRDITAANCAGGCVFTWQDERFKRTWNTMHAVNLRLRPTGATTRPTSSIIPACFPSTPARGKRLLCGRRPPASGRRINSSIPARAPFR